MSPSLNRTDWLAVGIVALTALAGVALWPQLPAEVAIHFSASGTPGNYVPKAVGVFLLPAVMAVTLLVMRAAMRFDPPDDPRVGRVGTMATMSLIGGLHVLVLGWNLGYPVPFDLVFVGSLLWGAVLCGYAIRREGLSVG